MSSHKAQVSVILLVLAVIGTLIYILSQQQSDRSMKGRTTASSPKVVGKALKKLYGAKQMETEFIGQESTKSEVYAAYIVIAQSADKSQLESLVKHNNPIARCYGIMALVKNKEITTLSSYAKALSQDQASYRLMKNDKLILQTVAQCYVKHAA